MSTIYNGRGEDCEPESLIVQRSILWHEKVSYHKQIARQHSWSTM